MVIGRHYCKCHGPVQGPVQPHSGHFLTRLSSRPFSSPIISLLHHKYSRATTGATVLMKVPLPLNRMSYLWITTAECIVISQELTYLPRD